MGSLFIPIYMSQMWPNYSSVCLLSAAAAQGKKRLKRADRELSTRIIFEPTVQEPPSFFFFLNSVSPCYLSTSAVSQCQEEILTKKYDCSLSKDKREKSRAECFTLRARILLDHFLASLLQVTVSQLINSEPSETQHLREEWGLGMLQDMDDKCSILKYSLCLAICK